MNSSVHCLNRGSDCSVLAVSYLHYANLTRKGLTVSIEPSFLDEVAENRQAKLEIDGSNIRIIAEKDSAINALEDINRLWLQRVVEVFPLLMPSAATQHGDRQRGITLFRPEDVALASSLTRTTMNYANDSNRKVRL